MRILMMVSILVLSVAPAAALDLDKHSADQESESSLGDGRFDLDMTQLERVPTSANSRFMLDSGFDPQATRPVSDGRYTLASRLQGKSTLGACNALAEVIFANGFEGP